MKLLNVTFVFLLALFFVQAGFADESGKKERFQKVDDSVVIDTQTGLMWAAQDNGKDIDWYEAQVYCNEFAAGGYKDWRLPKIKELSTLYTPDNRNGDGYFITDAIRITDCCLWSYYDTMGGALTFSFKSGKKPAARAGDRYQLRVLPVRSIEKVSPDK